MCALTGIILAALAGQNQGCIGRWTNGSPTYVEWHHRRVNQDPPLLVLVSCYSNVTTKWASVLSVNQNRGIIFSAIKLNIVR